MSKAKAEELNRKLKLQYLIADKKSASSLADYLDLVIINSSPDPKSFGSIITPIQKDMICKPLIPAIENVAGFKKRGEYQGVFKFMFILAKGWDKSSLQARLINWMLAYSKRPVPLQIYSGAADLKQSKIILEAMETEAKLNPWLAKKLVFTQNECKGPGGRLRCLTSDADTVAGILPDVIIMDEITRHEKPLLYRELVGGTAKRQNCLFIVITNAGVKDSWCWEEYQKAKNGDDWYMYESPPYVLAPWINSKVVAETRKSMTEDAARRLYDNIWTEEDENSFVLRSEVDKCEVLAKELQLCYRLQGQKGIIYYCGVDYGGTIDPCALCVLHHDKKCDIVILDKMDVWQGSPNDPIQIKAVEEWMQEHNRTFHNPIFIVDRYQLEGTIQKLEPYMSIKRFEYRGGKQNFAMAKNLKTLISNTKIAWPKDAGEISRGGKPHTISDEMVELITKRMSYGYRFDHEEGKHDDRAVAMGMAALAAVQDSYVGIPEYINPTQQEDTQSIIERLQKMDFTRPSHNLFGLGQQ